MQALQIDAQYAPTQVGIANYPGCDTTLLFDVCESLNADQALAYEPQAWRDLKHILPEGSRTLCYAGDPRRAIGSIAYALDNDRIFDTEITSYFLETTEIDIRDGSTLERAIVIYLAWTTLISERRNIFRLRPSDPVQKLIHYLEVCGAVIAKPKINPARTIGEIVPVQAPTLLPSISDCLHMDEQVLDIFNVRCLKDGVKTLLDNRAITMAAFDTQGGGITFEEYIGFHTGRELASGSPLNLVFDVNRRTENLPKDHCDKIEFVASWLSTDKDVVLSGQIVEAWEIANEQLYLTVPSPRSIGAVHLVIECYVRDSDHTIRRVTLHDQAYDLYEPSADNFGIVHLHIRCTSGSALTDYFNKTFGDGTVAEGYLFGPDHDQSFKSVRAFSKNFAGNLFSACHFRRDFFRGAWDNKVFMSVLRDPADRALSMYNFCRNYALEMGPSERRNWEAAGFDMDSVVATWENHILFEDNSMCRYLSGRPNARHTIGSFASENRIVGCFDYKAELLDYLADLLGVAKIELPESCVAPNQDYKQTLLEREPGLEKFLYQRNREDLVLYEYCKFRHLIVNVSARVEDGLRRRWRTAVNNAVSKLYLR